MTLQVIFDDIQLPIADRQTAIAAAGFRARVVVTVVEGAGTNNCTGPDVVLIPSCVL